MAKEIYREFQGEEKKLIYVEQTFFFFKLLFLIVARLHSKLSRLSGSYLSFPAALITSRGRNYLANSNTFQPRKMFPTMNSSRYRFRRRGEAWKMSANEGSGSSSHSKKGLVDKWVSIVKGEKPNSQKIPNVLTLEHSIRRETQKWCRCGGEAGRCESLANLFSTRVKHRDHFRNSTSLPNSTANVCMRARTYKLMFPHFSPRKNYKGKVYNGTWWFFSLPSTAPALLTKPITHCPKRNNCLFGTTNCWSFGVCLANNFSAAQGGAGQRKVRNNLIHDKMDSTRSASDEKSS